MYSLMLSDKEPKIHPTIKSPSLKHPQTPLCKTHNIHNLPLPLFFAHQKSLKNYYAYFIIKNEE